MNDSHNNDQNDLRSFLLMSELEKGEPVSQREIASRIGIALGLVNSYLKALSSKGFITVKAMPRNRFAYILTPKGFAEKSRLAFQHMNNFNKLFRVTRQESLSLFVKLREQGEKSVSFCGIDDFTEIAYLSLQEAQLSLEQVMDTSSGGNFLGLQIVSLAKGTQAADVPIVITALQRADGLKQTLRELGVSEDQIVGSMLNYEDVLRSSSIPTPTG